MYEAFSRGILKNPRDKGFIIGSKKMNNATLVKENKSDKIDSRAGKYLTFFLDREEYGVEIFKAAGPYPAFSPIPAGCCHLMSPTIMS